MKRPLRAASALFLSVLLTFSQNGWALNPFEKNHPLVQQGIDAYEAGRFEEALQFFEEAKKTMPTSAPVEFNRGNALYKLNRLEEAKQAYENAGKWDKGELGANDHFNMGNTHARLGDDKAAIKSYRRALRANPKDAEARHNLEVLMRKLPPPSQQQGQDGGTPDGGASDGGQQKDGGTQKPTDGGSDAGTDGGAKPDGGTDGGQQDGGEGDGGTDGGADGGEGDGGQGDGGQQSDAGSDGGSDGGSGEGEGKGENSDGGADGGEPSDLSLEGLTDGGLDLLPDGGVEGMSRDEAEKLLDAMKQNEKNLQLWKFQKQKPRKQNEKDW